jgi:large subunit ribosomal protein L9
MANKVLLVKDVENLGRKGQVVSARPGYIRNYLVPQGFGVLATAHALRLQAQLQAERERQAMEDRQHAEAAAAKMMEVVLVAEVKVDPDGHMYGSVSSADIIHMLQEQAGLEVERRSVQLKHSIKETGVHNILFKLNEGVTAEIKLKVIAEGTAEDAVEESNATA